MIKEFYYERFSIIDQIESAYLQILEEFDQVIDKSLYSSWPETFLYNSGWNVFGLRFMGEDIPMAHEVCPTLSKIIYDNSDLIATAGFSILDPGTIIYPHVGYTDILLRCHMGLRVPDGDCLLKVGDKTQKWENGKAFIFDDTFTHEAWNMTANRRTILLLDLQKKLLLTEQ